MCRSPDLLITHPLCCRLVVLGTDASLVSRVGPSLFKVREQMWLQAVPCLRTECHRVHRFTACLPACPQVYCSASPTQALQTSRSGGRGGRGGRGRGAGQLPMGGREANPWGKDDLEVRGVTVGGGSCVACNNRMPRLWHTCIAETDCQVCLLTCITCPWAGT